jgi:mannosyltransferase
MNISWLSNTFLTRGFWGDEAWTIGISRLPIQEIIRITGEDFHPPFYYFLVHYLGLNFGWGELTIRLLSTFFFLLVPILTYFLTQKFWRTSKRPSRLASTLAALITLTAPILLTYAFEARSYGLLAFESVLSAYIFWRAKDEARCTYRWRFLYFALGAIMVYTHYYAWFILGAHAMYLLISERKRILPMLTSALAILAAQLPWLPTLFGQVGEVKGDYWIGAINSRTHMEFFLRVTGGDLTTKWQAPIAIFIGLIILLDLIYRIVKKNLPKHYIFTLSWLLTPVLIPTLISITFMPVFFYRYLIFSAIPLAILLTRALARFPRTILVIGVIILIFLQLQVDSKVLSQHPRSMREATIQLNELKDPSLNDDPVYSVLPAFAEVMHYASPDHEIIITPEGLVQFSGKSLLDAYVRLGYTRIEEPPTSAPYFFLTPNKQVEYITPTN